MTKTASTVTITAGYASNTQLNGNFEAVNTALENTLSLDGSTPNAMNADLDMNNQDINNAGTVFADTLKVAGVTVTDATYVPAWKGEWVTATAYVVNDMVNEAGSSYICLTAHTAGTFSSDLTANYWELFAQQGSAGAGTGDMLGANNLSDIANTATSRANLGLGDIVTYNLSDDVTSTGAWTFSGANAPKLFIENPSASLPTDESIWGWKVDENGETQFLVYSDTLSSNQLAYKITRTAVNVDAHNYYTSGTLAAVVEPAGTTVTADEAIMTKEKADARYTQLTVEDNFTGLTITSGGAPTDLTDSTPPKFYACWLTCTSSDAGYAVGDVVPVSPNTMLDGAGSNSGFTIYHTGTAYKVKMGTDTSVFDVMSTSGVRTGLTNSKWTLTIEIYQ